MTKPHAPERRDIARRIALDGDEVGEQPFRDPADPVVHVQHARGDGGRAAKRGLGGHAVGHHQLEFPRVLAVRKHADVAAAQDRDPGIQRRS